MPIASAYEQTDIINRYINEAITYHNNRNYIESISSFNKALGLDPYNEKIFKNLSIVHNNYGKYLAERTDGIGALREFRNALYYDFNNEIARENLNLKLESMQYDPKNTMQRVIQSRSEKKAGNFYAAIAELRESNRVSKNAEAFLELGDTYYRLALIEKSKMGFYVDQAIKNLEQAHLLAPDDPRPKIRLGDTYIAQNRINEGIEAYEEAIKIEPSNQEAQRALINGWLAAIRVAPHIANNYAGLATAYQLNGDFDNAERSYRRALQLDPNNEISTTGLKNLEIDRINKQIDLYLNRAISYQKKGLYEESLSNYVRALNLDPENPDIHYNIGTAFQAKGDYDRAGRAYKRALELKPDYADANSALASLALDLKEKNIKEAFSQAIKFQDSKNYTEAIRVYEKLFIDRPDDDSLLFNIGICYQAMENYDKAAEYYKKAYEKSPKKEYQVALEDTLVIKSNVLLEEAIAAQTDGNISVAVKKYEEVVRLNPDNSGAWYNLGTAYQGEEKLDLALDAYKKAFELDPKEQSDAIFFSAAIYEQKKNFVNAIELYEKYIQIDPQGTYAGSAAERSKYIKSFI